MKIGIDFHGVIDKNPEFYSLISKCLINSNHEVHIITGRENDEKLRNELSIAGIVYHTIFSITSTYKDLDWVEFRRDNIGDPWMKQGTWDKAKAKYCEEYDIDCHIDDSEVYGQYFTGRTKYIKAG